MIERIADPDDPRVADYDDLRDGARRRRDGTFVAESRQVVRRLLGASRFHVRSVLASESAADDLADALRDGVRVFVADERTIRNIVGFNFHRGCVAIADRPPELSADALLDGRLLVVLERVTNPDNIGAAFRNALAFGADGVLLSPGCADPLYRKAIRVSMGATLRIPFASLQDWPAGLRRVRNAGFTVIALTPDGAVDIAALSPPPRIALVLGAEGDGLDGGTRAAADLEVAIPMASSGQSLNVATACGIALHRLAP